MAIRLLYRLFLQHLGQRRMNRSRTPGPAPAPQLATARGNDRRILKLTVALLIVALAVMVFAYYKFDLPARSGIPTGSGAELRLEIGAVSAGPVVVYLSGPGLEPSDLPAKADAARIESTNIAFAPFFQVLPPGSTVDAINSDLIPHNTHVFNRGETVFNVALPLKGVTVRKTITGSGIFSVRCDLHPWMQAWLFVPPSRHYAVLHEPGSVHFSNIAAGEYLLHLWQPDRLENIQMVSLSSNESKTLRLR